MHRARRPDEELVPSVAASRRRWTHPPSWQAGYADADRRAMELHALLTGTIFLSVAHQTSAFAVTVRWAAERLLD